MPLKVFLGAGGNDRPPWMRGRCSEGRLGELGGHRPGRRVLPQRTLLGEPPGGRCCPHTFSPRSRAQPLMLPVALEVPLSRPRPASCPPPAGPPGSGTALSTGQGGTPGGAWLGDL